MSHPSLLKIHDISQGSARNVGRWHSQLSSPGKILSHLGQGSKKITWPADNSMEGQRKFLSISCHSDPSCRCFPASLFWKKKILYFWLCWVFVAAQAFSSCSAWVSHCLGTWSQQLWFMVLVALWHAGSSCTRYGTHVPRIGRQILNHWTTREVLQSFFCHFYVIS